MEKALTCMKNMSGLRKEPWKLYRETYNSDSLLLKSNNYFSFEGFGEIPMESKRGKVILAQPALRLR